MQQFGYGPSGHLAGAEHADLDRVDPDVGEQRLELLSDDPTEQLMPASTPGMFWDTTAVVVAVRYAPSAEKVFRLAAMPAPPLGSVPAIAKTLAIIADALRLQPCAAP